LTQSSPIERAQPETFRGRALSASLTVKDLQKSLVWYRDVMRFIVDKQYDREGKAFAVALKAGTVSLLITQDDGAKGDRVKGEGFSLQITTAQNIDELAAGIKERGATLDSEPFDAYGARAFRLRDPDGFKLVISSER
jgi:catechol 2,3-dioxygenase-like lactoylglutathione lyase family enzyme